MIWYFICPRRLEAQDAGLFRLETEVRILSGVVLINLAECRGDQRYASFLLSLGGVANLAISGTGFN